MNRHEGEWPILSALSFLLPVLRLRVPRPCAFCKGGYDAADTMRCYACWLASHLWCASPALYHLFLLSPIAFLPFCPSALPVSIPSGTDPPEIPLCCGGICCDAGTRASADHRTGSGHSVDGNAGVEAAHSTGFIAAEKTSRSAPARLVRGRNTPRVLAGTFLRLQCLDDEKTSRETALHASQSCEAGTGRFAGTMAVEQLSIQSARRTWTGEGESRMGEDLVPGSGGIEALAFNSIIPALANCARTGHPRLW